MKLIFTLCFLLSISATSIAQSTFQTSFGSTEYDWAKGLVKTSSGNYCLLGTNGNIAQSRNVILYMVDKNGTLLWTSEIGTNEMEYPSDIIETPDGGFAITGFTYGGVVSPQSADAFIIKTDSLGNLEYMNTFFAANYSRGEKIILNPSGGYYIFGSTRISGSGPFLGMVIKIDLQGNQVWSNVTSSTTTTSYTTGTLSSDGTLIAAGYCSIPSNDYTYDNYISQFDTNGNMLWTKRYSNVNESRIWDIIPSTNGDFITLSNMSDSITTHINLCNYNSSGNIQWSNRYVSATFSEGMSIARSSNQDILVCGRQSDGVNNSLAMIARFDPAGNFILANVFGDPTWNSDATDIIEGEESSILIIGDISSNPVINSFLVKSDSLANSGCNQSPVVFTKDPIIFNDSSGGNSFLITMQDTMLNPNVGVFVSINSVYCFSASLETIQNTSLSVYPNPTSGQFRIEIGNYGQHAIDIYNSIGQKVMYKSFGEEFVDVDMSNYSPGIYFLKVDDSKSGKIVLTGE